MDTNELKSILDKAFPTRDEPLLPTYIEDGQVLRKATKEEYLKATEDAVNMMYLKCSPKERERMEGLITELESAARSGDKERIRSAVKGLFCRT